MNKAYKAIFLLVLLLSKPSNQSCSSPPSASQIEDIKAATRSGVTALTAPSFCWRKFEPQCPENTKTTNYKKIGALCYYFDKDETIKGIEVFGADKKSRHLIGPSHTYCHKDIFCLGQSFKEVCHCGYDPEKVQCSLIGLKNCGPAACAKTSMDCFIQIATFVIDAMLAIYSTVTFIGSLGTAGPFLGSAREVAKDALEALMTNIIKKALTMNSKQIYVLPETKSRIYSHAAESTNYWNMSKLKEIVDAEIIEENKRKMAVEFFSDISFGVGDAISNCMVTKPTKKTDFPATLSPASSPMNALQCGASIAGVAANFDPTGIASLALSFIKPECYFGVPKNNDWIGCSKTISNKKVEAGQCVPSCTKPNESGEYCTSKPTC